MTITTRITRTAVHPDITPLATDAGLPPIATATNNLQNQRQRAKASGTTEAGTPIPITWVYFNINGATVFLKL